MNARTKSRAAIHLAASSQGPRLAEPPTHDSKMAEMEKWTAILPAPPRPFGEQDEVSLQAWLTEVAEHGIEALRWCYHPDVWPFGLAMRGRVQHIVGSLIRGIEHQQKLKVEQAAREMAAKQQHAQRDLMREKGWK